ncbi:MAG: tannase/feruloyl esterase family alpha/beta hydrolase [Pseudomonadota bacterium]
MKLHFTLARQHNPSAAWRAPVMSLPVLLILAACGGNDGGAESPPVAAVPAFSTVCGALAGKTVGAGKITAAVMVAATASTAEACNASGEIVSSPASTIKFRLILPNSQAWNKKLLQFGGAGYNGSIRDIPADIARRNYATVASDSGHQGTVLSLSFALNNTAGFDNFAFASVPQVYAAALAGIRLAYDAAPQRKYFYGESTGGREALQQAQRYPANYDGIVALEPVIDYSAVNQKGIAVQKRIASAGGAGWLSPAKVARFDAARLASCDALDGLADGIIANPEACVFDPAVLRCPAGADTGDSCLSDAQLATVKVLTTNERLAVPTANGVTTAFQFGIGVEADAAAGWSAMHFGAAPSPIGSLLGLLSQDWARYAVLGNASADILAHDPADYASQWLASSIKSNANNPDMRAYAERGGKLLLWHGWSDHLVPPMGSIDLYGRTVQAMGTAGTNAFMRFYLSAGVTHSGTGPGATQTDFLTALESWVEGGTVPPDALLSKKPAADGTVALTRPTCRYPSWPRYNGSGDKNAAASFTCVGG